MPLLSNSLQRLGFSVVPTPGWRITHLEHTTWQNTTIKTFCSVAPSMFCCVAMWVRVVDNTFHRIHFCSALYTNIPSPVLVPPHKLQAPLRDQGQPRGQTAAGHCYWVHHLGPKNKAQDHFGHSPLAAAYFPVPPIKSCRGQRQSQCGMTRG